MNKVIRFIVILSLVFSSALPLQANPSMPDSASEDQQTASQLESENGRILKNQISTRYDPYDPSYYNSLRWLVYALILFLPFSPPTASNPNSGYPGGLRSIHE